MCQLMFVNSHRVGLNKLISMQLPLEDSRSLNGDGWGIFSKEKGIFKTALNPWATIGFGHRVGEFVADSPVILHVRSASRGTEVKVEFNHPFSTDSLVLAHNGTLDSKEKLVGYDDKLDSEVFLLELDKEFVKGKKKDLVTALKTTMERFTGKFAFLIYDITADKYYAVRGKTADLHIAYLLDYKKEKVGYIINTAKDDLINAVDTALEIAMMLGEKTPVLAVPEELPTESIFLLGNSDVEKVGEIKQGEVVYTSVPYRSSYWPAKRGTGYGYQGLEGAWGDDGYEDVSRPVDRISTAVVAPTTYPSLKLVDDLLAWLNLYGLEINDLDEILYQITGEGILSCMAQDVETVVKYVLAKISCKKQFREQYLSKASWMGQDWLSRIYAKEKFQYPYMLEPKSKYFIKTLDREMEELSKKK